MKISRFIYVIIFTSCLSFAQPLLITSTTLSFGYSNEEIKFTFDNLPIASEDVELIITYKLKLNPINWQFYNSYCCSEKNGRCLQTCTQEEKGSYEGSLFCRFPYDKQNYYYVPVNDPNILNTYTFRLSKDSINNCIKYNKQLKFGLFSPAENYSTLSSNYYYIRNGNGVDMKTKSEVKIQLKYNSFVPLSISNQLISIKGNQLDFSKLSGNYSKVELQYADEAKIYETITTLETNNSNYELTKAGFYRLKLNNLSGETSYSNEVQFLAKQEIGIYSANGIVFVENENVQVVKISNLQGQVVSFGQYNKQIGMNDQLGQLLLFHCVIDNNRPEVVKIRIE